MSIGFVGDFSPIERCAREFCGLLTVGNLECAFADGEVLTGKAYASILPTECIDNIAAAGFAALSVANNHAYDAGCKCFDSLIAELDRRSISYFGTIERPFVKLPDGMKRVAVIGCLEPCRSRGPRIFRQEDVTALIKRVRRDFDYIYVYPHWGMEGEYTRYPSPMQRKLARSWINAGADGVIGNHAHVPQGVEYYCGKPIYYCLGNFAFPLGETDSCPESRERMMVIIDSGMVNRHVFGDEKTEVGFKSASAILDGKWTLWKWAKTIGPDNLQKNMVSWRIRLRKNLLKTLPKFLAWQLMPKTLLFRTAAFFR